MNESQIRGQKWLWILLLILGIRLLTMALLPVTDTTEARYADISRLMADSDQWLVPQFTPDVPFWGKPPLFAWLTAVPMKLFGQHELLFRMPHFLLSLAVLWLTMRLGRERLSREFCALAAVILASSPLIFVSMGTVMTESGLLFSTTLAMTGFWLSSAHGSRAWGMLFFAGLGFGMLAKGPVGPALTLIPIVMWVISEGNWRSLRRLPWLPGSLLCLVIFVPWYMAAERLSPGFLAYFLVGEHLLRFIQPGWQGDLYGNPHRELPGMIWLFWFQATAAWGLLLSWYLLRDRKDQGGTNSEQRSWRRYLLSWLIAPLLLFTFSGNILWTYVITGLPAMALLLGGMIQNRAGRDTGETHPRFLMWLAMIVPVAAVVFSLSAPRGIFLLQSERALVDFYDETARSGEPLHYLDYIPVSARFYSKGTAQVIAGGAHSLPRSVFWLAVHHSDSKVPSWGCTLKHSPGSGVFELYRCTQ